MPDHQGMAAINLPWLGMQTLPPIQVVTLGVVYYWVYHIITHYNLVGGATTILKNMSSSMGRIMPYMTWKIKVMFETTPKCTVLSSSWVDFGHSTDRQPRGGWPWSAGFSTRLRMNQFKGQSNKKIEKIYGFFPVNRYWKKKSLTHIQSYSHPSEVYLESN